MADDDSPKPKHDLTSIGSLSGTAPPPEGDNPSQFQSPSLNFTGLEGMETPSLDEPPNVTTEFGTGSGTNELGVALAPPTLQPPNEVSPASQDSPDGGAHFILAGPEASTEVSPEPLPTHLSTPDLAAAARPAGAGAASARAHADLAAAAEVVGPGIAPTSAGAALGAEADIAAVALAARSASDAMAKVRDYADVVSAKRSVAAASFPFSLMITGELAPEERERLLDILSREQIGITEVDLEPQFTSGRILIPRISEYAGILIVQAMRAASVQMRFGPSDSIFSTEETRATREELDALETVSPSQTRVVSDVAHPAEEIPVTSDAKIAGFDHFEVIDTVLATATLKAKTVESSTGAFQEVLDGLQRELKYKAHRKGAAAIVHFTVQQLPLQMSASYRVIVSGTAIRARPVSPFAPVEMNEPSVVNDDLADLAAPPKARRAPSA